LHEKNHPPHPEHHKFWQLTRALLTDQHVLHSVPGAWGKMQCPPLHARTGLAKTSFCHSLTGKNGVVHHPLHKTTTTTTKSLKLRLDKCNETNESHGQNGHLQNVLLKVVVNLNLIFQMDGNLKWHVKCTQKRQHAV